MSTCVMRLCMGKIINNQWIGYGFTLHYRLQTSFPWPFDWWCKPSCSFALFWFLLVASVRICNGCRIISDCVSAMSCRKVPCVSMGKHSNNQWIGHGFTLHYRIQTSFPWPIMNNKSSAAIPVKAVVWRVHGSFRAFQRVQCVMRTRNVSLTCLFIIWVSCGDIGFC